MWSPDGRTLYFMSDAGGAENLYAQPFTPAATTRPAARRLTDFHDGRLLWPTISADGRTVVFERDFGLWALDVATGKAGPIPVRLRGVVAASAPQRQTLARDASELAVSHDGRKVAVVIHGQVFAAPVAATDPQPAFRVTHTDAIESNVTWAPDDRRLAYASTRDGPRHLYLYDVATRTETRLTDTPANDAAPAFSPDGSAVAFVRDGHELRAFDLTPRRRRRPTTGPAATGPAATGATTLPAPLPATARASRDRLLAGGLSLPQPPFGGRRTLAWAPAGDYVAVVTAGAKGFRNVYLVPAAGGPPRQASFVANAESTFPAWTPDGAAILFGSGQRTEDFDLARVDLKPRTPTFHADQFGDLFRQRPGRPVPEPFTPRQPTGGDDPTTQANAALTATAPTTGPTTRPDRTEVVFDGIEQRLDLLPVGVDVAEVAVSPDGKQAAVLGSTGSRANVYLYPLDPLVDPVARQLTASPGDKADLQFAADPAGLGTRLYFREGGRVRFVPVPTRAASVAASAAFGSSDTVGDVPVAAEMDVSFDRDKRVAFDQAWRYLADHFHDPAMHGLDWPAVRARFAPLVDGARTPADDRRVLSLMIGELNASHMGVAAPADDAKPVVGRLGLSWDPAEYDRTGRLRVAAVVPFGPAALAGVKPGQLVTAVDAASTERPANLDALLENKVDKDVTLAVTDAAGKRAVRLTAISGTAERTLLYKAWVQSNRDYVARASGGRLGYVHLADMGKPELARLSSDLDARNAAYAGVVVDVRNNSGGFVNGYALDVFARRNYLTLQGRDAPPVAGRTALGQRYLGLPTVLVTNRMTLSDGEDFAEGYQTLNLGDTVGEPTAGWIIFTSSVTLVDGTSLRLPAESVLDHNGVEMELHPRPVTTFVQRPVGEAAAGRDSQLDAAVADLLGKLK